MVKFVSLSSGSNGNCYYIGNGESGLIIDAGIGPRTIKKRLLELGISMDSVKFVLVTHDHIDHIKSLGILAQRVNIPVYATAKLHTALSTHFCTRGKLNNSCARRTVAGEFNVYDENIRFIPFVVPHDATETVGYYIEFFGVKFTFVTDAGNITDDIVKYVSMCNALILESNYDLDMLLGGGYTPELKLRITKGNGHLSNEQTCSIIKRAWHNGMTHIFLCHLSENNNTPFLAQRAAQKALATMAKDAARNVVLLPLPRRTASQIFEFEERI